MVPVLGSHANDELLDVVRPNTRSNCTYNERNIQLN